MAKKYGKTFVSAQQVAESAGVSRSAVSRTFTEGASVSEATRNKVMLAAESLGYHVNHLARGLISERSNIVCIIAANINAPYHATFIEVLTRYLQAAGKVGMIINSSGAVGVDNALRQTLHYRADATIVLSGQPAVSLIETSLNNGQRVIVVNRDDAIAGTESIVIANQSAAREAFHMLNRIGCKRIAVVSSQAGTPSLVSRELAFVEAAKSVGADVVVKRTGVTSYESGADVARQLFSGSDRPDGAFCVTDLLACGFMDAARHEFQISVPEELSVVGFDDIEQAGWSSYSLTTFKQPIEDIAARMVELLDNATGNGDDKAPIEFATQPVWRRSVRPR